MDVPGDVVIDPDIVSSQAPRARLEGDPTVSISIETRRAARLVSKRHSRQILELATSTTVTPHAKHSLMKRTKRTSARSTMFESIGADSIRQRFGAVRIVVCNEMLLKVVMYFMCPK
jgi:hypothetical protein